jgi:hypothetical protein
MMSHLCAHTFVRNFHLLAPLRLPGPLSPCKREDIRQHTIRVRVRDSRIQTTGCWR